MSARGPGDFAEAVSSVARDAMGRVRRMAVTLTNSAIWQVAGHVLLDKTRETRKAEVFGGIGIYARPPATGGTPEAIVVFPGGPEQAIIAATRDEATRRAVFKLAGEIADGETAIYSVATAAVIILKANGTVEIRAAGNPIVQSTILGTTYRAAEDTLLTAIGNLCTALVTSGTPLGTAPQITATLGAATAAAAAVTAFQAAAATYLTTVVKVQ